MPKNKPKKEALDRGKGTEEAVRGSQEPEEDANTFQGLKRKRTRRKKTSGKAHLSELTQEHVRYPRERFKRRDKGFII